MIIIKVKACPFCDVAIPIDKSGKIPEFCPDCGNELNPKEILNLNIKETSDYISNTNTIANVLKWLGWATIILGFLVGIIIAGMNDSYISRTPSWLLMLPYWIGGFVSGSFMLGFSEIINLLHQINLK